MDDKIRFDDSEPASLAGTRRLQPMKIEGATVWIEQNGPGIVIDSGDEIYTVSSDPKEAFTKAVEVVRGILGGITRGILELKESARPNELTIEFSLTFEVEGKAAIIPVLLTGSSTTSSGMKISAAWKWPEESSQG